MKEKFKNIDEILSNPLFIEWLCDPSEETNAYWTSLSNSDSGQAVLIQEARNIFNGITIDAIQVAPKVQSEVYQAIQNKKNTGQDNTIFLQFLKIAAALLFIVAAISFFLIPKTSYNTDYGITKNLSLKDGTKIVMNANSNLRVDLNADDNQNREVWMDGEAFFEVTSDPEHPFTVHTSRGDIIVVGTKFNVVDTREEFSVYLTEGKIKFEPNKQYQEESINIDVKKRLIFKEAIKGFELETSNDPNILAWKDKQIICDEMSILELSKEIESYYGVKVVIKQSSLADRELNGTLENQSLEELLFIISETFDLNIISNKSSIEFSYN